MTKTCKICGGAYAKNPRITHAQHANSSYCSKACFDARGKLHRQAYHEEARRKVDLSTCDACGMKKDGLEVHHIDGNWKNNKDANLLVVCHRYHCQLHFCKHKTPQPCNQ
jgi:hypothetical protein